MLEKGEGEGLIAGLGGRCLTGASRAVSTQQVSGPPLVAWCSDEIGSFCFVSGGVVHPNSVAGGCLRGVKGRGSLLGWVAGV